MHKVQQKVDLFRHDGFFNCMSFPVYQIEQGWKDVLVFKLSTELHNSGSREGWSSYKSIILGSLTSDNGSQSDCFMSALNLISYVFCVIFCIPLQICFRFFPGIHARTTGTLMPLSEFDLPKFLWSRTSGRAG